MPSNKIPPAALKDIIPGQFFNASNKAGLKIIFSRAILTPEQEALLVYPEGFTPTDNFFINQLTSREDDGTLTTAVYLLAILLKEKYFYGYFFSVDGQDPYDEDLLTKSCDPIPIDSAATFTANEWLETYFDINGVTLLFAVNKDGLSILQYRCCQSIAYEAIESFGLLADLKLEFDGLSKNLQNKKCDHKARVVRH